MENIKKQFSTNNVFSGRNLMVAVSGGRSSAMMARHIQTSEKYKDFEKIFVFANTGQERVETIDFLKNIVKFWGIDLNIVEAVVCLYAICMLYVCYLYYLYLLRFQDLFYLVV